MQPEVRVSGLRRLAARLMLRYGARNAPLPRLEVDPASRRQLDNIARARHRQYLFPPAFERQFQDYVRNSMAGARTVLVLITLFSFLSAPLWSPPLLHLPDESRPLTWLVCYGIILPAFALASWLQLFHPLRASTEAWFAIAFLIEVAAIELMIYGTDATGFHINVSMAVCVPVAMLPIARIRVPAALAFGGAYFAIVFTRETFWPGVLSARTPTDWLLELVLVTAAVASVAFSRLSLRRAWAANVLLDASASTDAMTGLPNRSAFEAHFQHFAPLSRRRHAPSVLALVDLDHFKRVNDRYGHPYGDGVLVEFSMALAELARLPGDMAARLGGEEFGLFLHECGAASAGPRLEEFLATLRELGIAHEDSEFKVVTASIGGVELTGTETLASAYHAADRCLYEAKQAGRNCVRIAPGA